MSETLLSFTVHLANSVFKVHILSHIPLNWMFFVFIYFVFFYFLGPGESFKIEPFSGAGFLMSTFAIHGALFPD